MLENFLSFPSIPQLNRSEQKLYINVLGYGSQSGNVYQPEKAGPVLPSLIINVLDFISFFIWKQVLYEKSISTQISQTGIIPISVKARQVSCHFRPAKCYNLFQCQEMISI